MRKFHNEINVIKNLAVAMTEAAACGGAFDMTFKSSVVYDINFLVIRLAADSSAEIDDNLFFGIGRVGEFQTSCVLRGCTFGKNVISVQHNGVISRTAFFIFVRKF